MEIVSTKRFLQVWLWALVVVSVLAILQTIQRTTELEIILLRSKWIGLVGVFALTAVGGVWLSLSPLLTRISDEIEKRELVLSRIEGTQSASVLRFAFFVFLLVLPFLSIFLVRLYIFGSILPQVMPILWVFLWASLIQTIGLKLLLKLEWHKAFVVVVLTQGVIYQTYGVFAAASADPFSMGYSEAGRHYYASLFFSEKLYGMELPLPFLHPSRYLLLSVPFLVDGLPLWLHRFWQALLWFGLTLGASLSLARFSRSRGWTFVFITAWAFLFYFQGAVYYHLHVMVILILLGVSVEKPGRSLAFIILASLWAGISRVNWFPVPAMLAVAMYVLQTPVSAPAAVPGAGDGALSKGKIWKYWLTPFIWGVSGIAAALIAQFVYIQISGNADLAAFGSSFSSDLIWSRLLPNETFPMGILPGILLVSAPVFAALYQMIFPSPLAPLPKREGASLPLTGEGLGMRAIHPLRWLVLIAMLAVLFVGGAIVSAKIGGGGDLHNMDAYLVMLSVLATAFWSGQVSAESEAKPMMRGVGWGVVMAAWLIPLGFAIRHIGFYPTFDQTVAEKDIHSIQAALANGGEILFITERQLIAFDYVNGVTLVSEYEQSELMEMAMSRNRPYLEAFYADLHERRFTLVIAEDQKFVREKEGAFAEENTAWVRYVGAPLLCNYKPVVLLSSNNLQIFEPRPKQVECRDPFAE